MRVSVLAVLLPALIAAAAPPATQPGTQPATAAAAPQEPPTIHRMAAGEPDAGGWYAARSTGSGFTVSMPRKFNDLTVSHRDADGSVMTTHMVASVAPSPRAGPALDLSTRFAASATTSSAAKLPPDAADTFVKMLGERGEVRATRKVTMDGVDATEIEVMTAKSVTRHRVVQFGDVIYNVSIELPGQEFLKKDEAAAKRFFESFRFPAPEKTDAPGARA